MSVLFSVRNVGPERVSVGQAFDDGLWNVLAAGVEGKDIDKLFTVDGVFVVDAANAKRHSVARDPSGRCVCSAAQNAYGISPEQQVTLTAVFAAVPEDVSTVSVVIPLVGEFADVPVTR